MANRSPASQSIAEQFRDALTKHRHLHHAMVTSAVKNWQVVKFVGTTPKTVLSKEEWRRAATHPDHKLPRNVVGDVIWVPFSGKLWDGRFFSAGRSKKELEAATKYFGRLACDAVKELKLSLLPDAREHVPTNQQELAVWFQNLYMLGPDDDEHAWTHDRKSVRRLADDVFESSAHVFEELSNSVFVVREIKSLSGGSANRESLFPGGPPDNIDIVDLVIRLDTEKNRNKSLIQIAREFTRGDAKKAQSLLSQIRRLKREGRVNL